MQKNNTQSFEFSKKIKLNFEGGEISSDAGLLVVHEFCEKFGVQKLFIFFLFPPTFTLEGKEKKLHFKVECGLLNSY